MGDFGELGLHLWAQLTFYGLEKQQGVVMRNTLIICPRLSLLHILSRYGEGVTGVASVRILAWQLVQYGITDCVPQ